MVRQSAPGFCSSTASSWTKARMVVRGVSEVGLADPLVAMAHESAERLVRHEVLGRVAAREHRANVSQQDQDVLGREVLKSDDRPRQVDEAALGEAVLRQPTLEAPGSCRGPGGCRAETPACRPVRSRGRGCCPAARRSKSVRSAQSLIACLRALQLVEVDEFVEHDEQAAVAGQPHEGSKQLERVVDAVVVDDGCARPSV